MSTVERRGEGVLFVDLAATSEAVAATSGRLEKTRLLAELLRKVPASRAGAVASMLVGDPMVEPLGLGPARIREARSADAAGSPTLTLGDVEEGLARIAAEAGPGSVKRKIEGLRGLLAMATPEEQAFLLKLCFGELRQGALGGVMADAIAEAFGVRKRAVRRSYMLSGDLGEAASLAASEGEHGLAGVGIRLMRPVEPMLASSAETVGEALARHGRLRLEWKLDGARIQVHKQGDEIRVFSRNLRDVGAAVPEVVEAARALPAGDLVLDGEAIALKPDGRPESFQVTMSRFGRTRTDGDEGGIRLTPYFFDVLHADGSTLVDLPLDERVGRLERLVPDAHRLPSLDTDEADLGQRFLEQARSAGHEGVMAKDPGSPYQAGRRGKGWLKIKPANTLDLVVLAVEPGSGRRSGLLSNIHLGARDPATGGFVMLGKTFKGMTDETLRWQTETFPAHVRHEESWVLHLHPRFVVEIAFNEIQKSRRYPGGLALRFARLKGYRPDKDPEDADTIDTVRRMYEAMTGDQAPRGDAGAGGGTGP